jgi:predicted ATP-grasp superfamily ATP-dependent carboligase
VLIPVTESSLLALLPEKETLEERGVNVPFPPLEVFAAVSDRTRLLETARDLGMAVPSAVTLESAEDQRDLRVRSWPVVVKPARSVSEDAGDRIKLQVAHAANDEELGRILRALPAAAYPILIQQRIVGPGLGVFLLIWNDTVRAVFAHRRIREKPPQGGVSVYRESIAAEAGLVTGSVELLRRFDWQGVAMVEYKKDRDSGVPYLMEVNGRFWGSLQLAIDSGVDFPRLLLEASEGQTASGVPPYEVGVRSRWWWGDVDHLYIRLRRSDRYLSLPPGAPRRLRALLEFLKVWRPGDRSEVLRARDPGPFFREAVDWFLNR